MSIQEIINEDQAAVSAAQQALDAAKAKLAADIASDPAAPTLDWFGRLMAHVDKWPSEAAAELHALVTEGKNILGI